MLWTTFAATLLFPLDFAIILGVFLSLIIYLRQASRPSVVVRVPDPRERSKRPFNTAGSLPQCPQLAIVRIDGALFFGAVSWVAERLRMIARHNPLQKHLLLLARSVSYLDVAGAEMLAREVRLRRAAGGQVYFHQVKEGPMEILRRGGYRDEIGEENFFLSKAEAIGGGVRSASTATSACAARCASSTSAARCRSSNRAERTAAAVRVRPAQPPGAHRRHPFRTGVASLPTDEACGAFPKRGHLARPGRRPARRPSAGFQAGMGSMLPGASTRRRRGLARGADARTASKAGLARRASCA